MLIEVRNVSAKVLVSTEAELDWLARFLTVDPGGRESAFRLYRFVDRSFPAGLAPMVRREAAADGVKVEVIDRRLVPHSAKIADLIAAAPWGWLHAHQREACAAMLAAGRGITKSPTGSGKGEMAIALAAAVPVPWLFLVHRSNLVTDVAGRWRRQFGAPARLLGPGSWAPAGHRLCLSTFKSLHVHLADAGVAEALAQYGGLIVDEAHVLPAATFSEVAASLRHAYYRLGLSGTPFDRGDRRGLVAVGHLGEKVYEISGRELVDLGLIAEPTIRMLEYRHKASDQPDDVDERVAGMLDEGWTRAYRRGVVENRGRNAVVLETITRAEKPCMVFFHRLNHGRGLLKELRRRGITASMASGACSPKARDRIARELATGDAAVVLANEVFQEGLDVPELMSVVNAGGLKTTIATLQKLGRGTRRRDRRGEEVKASFTVWDVLDLGHRWMAPHAAQRMLDYQRAGWTVTVERPTCAPSAGRSRKVSRPGSG